MDIQELVSLIVPFYETEEVSFKACINSLLSQDYSNIEIIIVNDGSDEKYKELLTRVEKLDKKISVYNKSINQGLSASRNFGLTVCKGMYVVFVDSDDMLNPNAISEMVKAKKETNADLIIGGLKVIKSYDLSREDLIITGEKEIYSNKIALEKMLIGAGFGSTACGRLANKDFWLMEGDPFIEGILHEDMASIWRLFVRSKVICWLPTNIYYYFQGGQTSIHAKEVSEKFCKDFISALEDRNNGVLKNYEGLENVVSFSYLQNCPLIYMYASQMKNKKSALMIKKKARKLFLDNFLEGMKYSFIDPIQKKKAIFFRYMPRFYCVIYSMFRKVKGLRK